MSDVSQWSPIDANNSATPPDGAPEGMSASAVNDTIRANMGGVRRQEEEGGWLDWGHTATYVSADTFQVPGDLSAVYSYGRRVRVTQTGGSLFGTVTLVTVSANTDVRLAIDEAKTIANEAMTVAVGVDPNASADGALVGEVRLLSHGQLKPNWLEASGQTLNKADYPALDAIYAADGYPWGSDPTTFNLPPLNGRVPIGRGQGNTAEGGGAGTNWTLGTVTGAETHTLIVDELAPHTHTQTRRTTRTVSSGGVEAADNTLESVATGSTGLGTAHNNMQPSLTMVYVVRVL